MPTPRGPQVFAVDSIPAIFGVTSDPLVVRSWLRALGLSLQHNAKRVPEHRPSTALVSVLAELAADPGTLR